MRKVEKAIRAGDLRLPIFEGSSKSRTTYHES